MGEWPAGPLHARSTASSKYGECLDFEMGHAWLRRQAKVYSRQTAPSSFALSRDSSYVRWSGTTFHNGPLLSCHSMAYRTTFSLPLSALILPGCSTNLKARVAGYAGRVGTGVKGHQPHLPIATIQKGRLDPPGAPRYPRSSSLPRPSIDARSVSPSISVRRPSHSRPSCTP